jgi:hypothetical protein
VSAPARLITVDGAGRRSTALDGGGERGTDHERLASIHRASLEHRPDECTMPPTAPCGTVA